MGVNSRASFSSLSLYREINVLIRGILCLLDSWGAYLMLEIFALDGRVFEYMHFPGHGLHMLHFGSSLEHLN